MSDNFYVVKSGDNLWKICEKELGIKDKKEIYHTINLICKENNIKQNAIFSGQKLNLNIMTDKKTIAENSNSIFNNEKVEESLNFDLDELLERSFFKTNSEFINDTTGISKFALAITNKNNICNLNNEIKNEIKNLTVDNIKDINKSLNNSSTNKYSEEEIQVLIEKGIYTQSEIQKIKNSNKKRLYTEEEIQLIKNTKKYSKEEIKTFIKNECKKYGIDPLLIFAIVDTESKFNQFAKNKWSGASGLMQLMPITIKHWSKNSALNLNGQNKFDALTNLSIGIRHFADLFKKFKNDVQKAIYAYNFGETNYRKHEKGLKNLPKETQEYYPKIMNNYKDFGGNLYT